MFRGPMGWRGLALSGGVLATDENEAAASRIGRRLFVARLGFARQASQGTGLRALPSQTSASPAAASRPPATGTAA